MQEISAVRLIQSLTWCAVIALLGACGGGGGGTASSIGTDPGTPTSTSTGLIPAPVASGQVLQSDATKLRPLVSNAVWTYRGTDIPYTGATPTSYTNVVTQTTSATGITESSTDAAHDGADTSTLSSANGNVSSTSALALTDAGPASQLTYLELRSPVRQNDQTTVLDTHLADAGGDVDGDGKNDASDVAIYRVVIGAEDVTLANLPTLHAVRVDTIGIVRFTLSSTGKATAPIQAINVSTWYAPGIGIVRQRSTSPADNSVRVVEETLTSWDGVTQGFGALADVKAVLPGESGNSGISGRNAGFAAAFVVGDHALVVNRVIDPITVQTLTQVSRMDQRGAITQTETTSAPAGFAPTYIALPDGVAAVESNGGQALAITRWDTDGHLIGNARDGTLTLLDGPYTGFIDRYQVIADGVTLWAAWTQNVPFAATEQLRLRQFSRDGTPLSEAVVVAEVDTNDSFALAAKDGRVLVTWAPYNGGGATDVYFAVVGAGGLLRGPTTAGSIAHWDAVQPLLLDNGGVLTIPHHLGATTNGGFGYQWAAVLLDASYTPLRSTSAGFDTEVLAGSTVLTADDISSALPSSNGNRLSFVGKVSDTLYPDTGYPTTLDVVTWLDATSGPLATAPNHVVRSHNSDESIISTGAYAQLMWPDRVLLLSGDYQLSSRLVWLNAGTPN